VVGGPADSAPPDSTCSWPPRPAPRAIKWH